MVMAGNRLGMKSTQRLGPLSVGRACKGPTKGAVKGGSAGEALTFCGPELVVQKQ